MNRNINIEIQKIKVLLKSGRVDDAITLCRSTIKAFPKNSEAPALLSQIEFNRGNIEPAINSIKKAIKRSPKKVELHIIQGDMYIQQKLYSKAEKAYTLAFKLSPKEEEIKKRLAYALQEQPEKVDNAIDLYKSILEKNLTSSTAHYNLGTALKRKHLFADALNSYRKAVELSPGDADMQFSLANILFEIGNFNDAADELKKLLEIDPDIPTALFQLAYVSKRLKRSTDSITAAKRLTIITNNSANSLCALAAAKIMNSDYNSALQDCELGLSKKPKDRRLLSEKTIALSGKGDKISAKNLFNIDELLFITKINIPESHTDITDFNQDVIKHIDKHPSLSFSGVSHSCHKGSTSNDKIFEKPSGPLKYLLNFIQKSASQYREKISIDVSHPWKKYLPSIHDLDISGWVTKLNSQGYQQGHIHETAWISGVYYVNLPSDRKSEAGAIEFGRTPFYYPDGDQGQIKVINPEPGTLVLFPSFFYHRTIPFESRHNRVTIAFDFRTEDLS